MNQKIIKEALVNQYNRNREYCDQITDASQISNTENKTYIPFSQKEEKIRMNVVKLRDDEIENIRKTQNKK